MAKPIITKQMLLDKKACADQVELFEATFGDSVVVTVARAKKFAGLFNWKWGYAAARMLDDAAFAEYYRDIAPAQTKYYQDTSAGFAEWRRTPPPTYVLLFPTEGESAFTKYNHILATALAEYSLAMATAFAKAFINMHKRRNA